MKPPDFEPGEAAQVDFGKGPEIIDVKTGEVISTHFFVMTLGPGAGINMLKLSEIKNLQLLKSARCPCNYLKLHENYFLDAEYLG
jgi:hypothetical protein